MFRGLLGLGVRQGGADGLGQLPPGRLWAVALADPGDRGDVLGERPVAGAPAVGEGSSPDDPSSGAGDRAGELLRQA